MQLISWVFPLLGVGVLCPWNAFINARPYFEARLCGEGKFFISNIEVWFSLVYNVASVASLAVLLLAQAKSNGGLSGISLSTTHETTAAKVPPTFDRTYGYMTMVSLALYFAVFLFATIAVVIPSISATVFLAWTLVGLFLCGVCTSVASVGIVGTAGLFEPEVGVGPYFQGQAAGGLFVAIANLIAAASDDPDQYHATVCDNQAADSLGVKSSACGPYVVSWSTMAYFLLGTLSIVACMVGFSHVEQHRAQRTNYARIESEAAQNVATDKEVSAESVELENTEALSASSGSVASLEHAAPTLEPRREKIDVGVASYSVWKATKWLAASLFTTYVVTLAIFPVITSDLASVHRCRSKNRLFNDLFVPVTFLVFNAGDLAGRFVVTDASGGTQANGLDKKLLWASVGRLAFVPLFLLCFSPKSLYQRIAVKSDAFSWLVQFLFAFSNGSTTSLCFSYAPSLVALTEEMQQISSAILNFSLCCGLLIGSCLSFPLLWAFTGRW